MLHISWTSSPSPTERGREWEKDGGEDSSKEGRRERKTIGRKETERKREG